ncbi:hypothetical protein LTR27_013021 [Elasticomyces elasticus]|nr:hypothetical protein LTR27_013021 [Elasticomyces elasticus]
MRTRDHDKTASSLRGALTAWIYAVMSSKYAHGRARPFGSGSILYVSSRICIKSSVSTRLAESNAMELVRLNTSIPVPKFYFTTRYKGRVYIAIQRMRGTYLGHGWYNRTGESKQRVLKQLKGMVAQLVDLKSEHGTRDIWGPFNSVADFHRALVDHQDIGSITHDKLHDLQDLARFYDQQGPETVFTHGDLSSLNILCEGDNVTGIVDWETSGWFPPYWEYVCAWNVNPQNEFWQQELDKILPALSRARDMDTIRRKYFGFFGYTGSHPDLSSTTQSP